MMIIKFNKKFKLFMTIFISIAICAAIIFSLSIKAFAISNSEDKLYGETLSSRGMSVKNCPSITAQYAVMIHKNGDVIYERNSYGHAKIASLTKIVTAIVALENSEMTDIVTVTQKAYDIGESSAGV